VRVYTTRDDAGSSPGARTVAAACDARAGRRGVPDANAPYHRFPIRERKAAVRTRANQAATLVMYAAMLLAVLALWNNDAPSFIYVAF
jgi:hypothetical protein